MRGGVRGGAAEGCGRRCKTGRFCAHRTGARFSCVNKSIRRRRNYPASSHNQEERHIRRVSRKVSRSPFYYYFYYPFTPLPFLYFYYASRLSCLGVWGSGFCAPTSARGLLPNMRRVAANTAREGSKLSLSAAGGGLSHAHWLPSAPRLGRERGGRE